jgi:hypothetical protein
MQPLNFVLTQINEKALFHDHIQEREEKHFEKRVYYGCDG